LLVLGMVGGGTWAYFSDTEATGTNVLTAGTLDLDLGGGDDLGTVIFNLSTKAPGDADNHTIALNYPTTNVPAELDLTFGTVNNVGFDTVANPNAEYADDTGNLGASLEIAPYIDIAANGSFDGGTDIALGSSSDNHTTSALQWDALDNFSTNTWDDLYSAASINGTADNFVIEWRIPTSAGNSIQGDSANFTMTFTLEQTTVD
ncbi:TasA family protein, partial [Chloroflexota bacterium]